MDVVALVTLQVLTALVVVAVGVREVRRTRREYAALDAELAREAGALEAHLARLAEAAENPGRPVGEFVTSWVTPTVLRLTLELSDPDAVPDLGRVARDVEQLLAAVSDYERAIGGRGLVFTGAKADPGRVVLTLTPGDDAGAAARVRKVAEAVNADPPAADPVPKFPPLPAGVSAARAGVALAA